MSNWDLAYCLVVVASFPLPCHCEEGQRPDVAISRYNLTTIISRKIEVSAKNVPYFEHVWVSDILPGDCQEVNCPKGARETTLGCGPSGLAMTVVVVI